MEVINVAFGSQETPNSLVSWLVSLRGFAPFDSGNDPITISQGKNHMRKARYLIATSVVCAAVLAPSTAAFAVTTGNQGQPSQSCQAEPNSPPGFNTAGFAHAETVYGGSQPQNSNNPKSVAQYDVACYQVSQPHP
jgi:hypothetical protein